MKNERKFTPKEENFKTSLSYDGLTSKSGTASLEDLKEKYEPSEIRVCPICEQGALTSCIENTVITKYGEQYTVESRYSICNYCGSEQVGSEEALYNKREMKNTLKYTADEWYTILEGLILEAKNLTEDDCVEIPEYVKTSKGFCDWIEAYNIKT
jgi:hypothetical protein